MSTPRRSAAAIGLVVVAVGSFAIWATRSPSAPATAAGPTVATAGIGGPASSPSTAGRQEVVTLRARHGVHAHPSAGSARVAVVSRLRPITGEQTVLPVLHRTVDARGRTWLDVRLPGRALGGSPPPAAGWIRAANSVPSATAWSIDVNLTTRHVAVFHHGSLVHDYRAVVGKAATPTPTGEFFVEENVRLSSDRPGAPFALALSARSGVLQDFDGGPGQIALHGLDNVGGTLGTAASHGCVRLSDAAITWLAARIQPGTPVTIT